jgi:hypothetical protein
MCYGDHPLQTVTADKNVQLYSLRSSPICVNEAEKSLLLYPLLEVAKELIEGLRFGFKLKYTGTRLPVLTKNSKSVSERNEVVCRKIKKEITMGRVAGPFNHPPMPTLRISPIFLITKNNGDFRLIHNLSQPAENSVNDFIDSKFCSVRYLSIDDAVRLVKRIGHAGKLAKADVKSAFRLLRVSPSAFDQLGFIFNKKYYYDKCLPMGASISCSLFEKCLTALYWFTEIKSGNENILHYLDDFLFGGETNTSTCKETPDTFKDICSVWGVPLAEDKTVEPVEVLTFLGIEFDTIRMELRLPKEKLFAINHILTVFMH